MRGGAEGRRGGRGTLNGGRWAKGGGRVRRFAFTLASILAAALLIAPSRPSPPPTARCRRTLHSRIDRGRFTAVFYPSEATLAASLLDDAVETDTFPGIAAAHERRCSSLIAPDAPISGVGRSRRPRVGRGDHVPGIAPHRDAGQAGRTPRRAIRARCFGTRWRTWRCTNHSATCRRGGSMRATRATRRASGARRRARDQLALAFRGTPTFDELDADLGAGAIDGAERVCARLSRCGRAGGAGSRSRARAVLRELARKSSRSTGRCAVRTA